MKRRVTPPSLVSMVSMSIATASCVTPQRLGDWLLAGVGPVRFRVLDDETIGRLTLSMDSTVQMRPGVSKQFSLGRRLLLLLAAGERMCRLVGGAYRRCKL